MKLSKYEIQDLIERLQKGENIPAKQKEIHWDAVLREFQIIGDATNNLIEANFLSRKYRMIVDCRNLITHPYFGIDYVMVWDIIHLVYKL